MIVHKRDSGNESNNRRKFILKSTAKKRAKVEGLSTSVYYVKRVEERKLYTWLTVDVDQDKVYQTAPKNVLENYGNMGLSQRRGYKKLDIL